MYVDIEHTTAQTAGSRKGKTRVRIQALNSTRRHNKTDRHSSDAMR